MLWGLSLDLVALVLLAGEHGEQSEASRVSQWSIAAGSTAPPGVPNLSLPLRRPRLTDSRISGTSTCPGAWSRFSFRSVDARSRSKSGAAAGATKRRSGPRAAGLLVFDPGAAVTL